MRFLSWIFLILTIAAVVMDWISRPEGGSMVLRPLSEVWEGLHPASFERLQSMLEQNASSGIWESVLQSILNFPAALSFGIAFLFFKTLSALLRRPKGYHNVEPV